MKKGLLSICAVTVATALSGVGTAQAATFDTSMCSNQTVTQEFAPWGDTNYYAAIPGISATGFTGAGWALSGGAKIATGQLPNGTTGTVLDLPSGGMAVSPVVCIQNTYPTARGWLQDVKGTEGVGFYVAYENNTNSWTRPLLNGTMSTTGSGWTLPGGLKLQPTQATGWQPIQITLVGNGTTSEFRVNDLELDPRFTY